MRVTTYKDNEIAQRSEDIGTERVIKDGDGREIGREPLSPDELARFQAEGQPTPDEKFVSDVAAATTVAGLKAAILARFGG